MKRCRGQSLIEFVLAAVMITPFVLLFADSSLLLYAKHLNDTTCDEAARIGSTGDPKLVFARALQIVTESQSTTPPSVYLRLVRAQSTITQSAIDALQPYGGQVRGTVEVTTEVAVTPSFIRCFLGKDSRLLFKADQQYPSTYSVPSAFDRAAPKGNYLLPTTSEARR